MNTYRIVKIGGLFLVEVRVGQRRKKSPAYGFVLDSYEDVWDYTGISASTAEKAEEKLRASISYNTSIEEVKRISL